MSLKKLYQNQIQNITSIDGEVTNNLDGLKHLISVILEWKSPRFIRTLDHVTPIAKDGDFTAEHADHSVSARIVHDVINDHKIPGNVTRYVTSCLTEGVGLLMLLSYGGNLIRTFDPTLEKLSDDFANKVIAYREYAQYDKDMVSIMDMIVYYNDKF